jgi:hypothetical protein
LEQRWSDAVGDGAVTSADMDQPVKFDDLPPDEMVEFLSEAHRHSEFDPGDPGDRDFARLAPLWECKGCGTEYPIEEVLVADGEPKCPHCEASGWEFVIPRGGQPREGSS